ncbi:zinc ribbon domain-containing protein [Halobacillus yeomjeoni]|uniref:Zinc-ribbon domain-containing protein n=1 Tax=Halobacillus yeomjeoni TaxID=311194 RepID=A0A931HSN9_9BACI|nr:zinc ribbon domain-containing protein [Halobacillus yeomjeoni]MBH0228880.1 zinc-ribbon domain-containing protein [Halobacillus yeomjeoni]
MNVCPHCKKEVSEGSRYCSQCGQPIKGTEEHHIHKEKSGKKSKRWWPVIVPVITLIIMTITFFVVYTHQKNVNEEVLNMKKQAEESALSGNYEKAEKILVQAVDRRPEFQVLQSELNAVQTALFLSEELDDVEKQIKENQLKTAESELKKIQNQIQEQKSRLLVTLTPEANHLESRITVMKVNDEISRLSTVDELAGKLNTLSGLNLEEASKVRKKINEKIITLSTKKAEDALAQKQYSEAIAIVDQALQYVSNDEKLMQLKERIKQEQTAFEQEQRKRLEKAMEQAAEDELKNKTDALEVVEAKLTKDEYGDIKVTGKVKSVATQIISTITAKYDILNEKGKVVKSEEAKVYPIYLNPGDVGTFEKVYYELDDGEYSVKITEMEWLVE